jgi:large subunit ribosomal protein L10
MPLSRQQKVDLVDKYKQEMAGAPHAFLLDYKGITVPQVTELRAKIRETGGQYLVVKNTLALRAIEGQPLEQLKELFDGPVAVAYSQDDAVSLAKALTTLAKTVPAIQVRGGLVNGQAVEADQVKEIAELPTREELIAKLLFLLQSPVTRFVRVLAAVPRDFVVVLEQVRQKKEGAA